MNLMKKNLFFTVIDVNLLERSQDSEEEPKAGMSTLEEQLMTTAFYRSFDIHTCFIFKGVVNLCFDVLYYRLGVNAQRDAIDAKLALLMGQGQTFLARQRQSAPRKSLTTFKNK
uniref:Protein hook n=1 Tax=Bactrocera latifrons TaxID=174628 RepID=A0A0K8V4A2_BACLA